MTKLNPTQLIMAVLCSASSDRDNRTYGETARLLLAELQNSGYQIVDTDSADPLTEDSSITRARATASLELSLAAFDASPDDKAVLQRMVEYPWMAWCTAMQQERLAGTDAYRMRAAALLLCVNVFWETICMSAHATRWTTLGERLLEQITTAIRQGPGR